MLKRVDNYGEILRANPQDCLWVDGEHRPKKLSEKEGSSFFPRVRKVKKERIQKDEIGK